MPRYIISGRIPGSDEDNTGVIEADSRDEAVAQFRQGLYGGDEAWAARKRENCEFAQEFEGDKWPSYITFVTVSYEPELIESLKAMLGVYEGLKEGEQDWAEYTSSAEDAQELLDKLEVK